MKGSEYINYLLPVLPKVSREVYINMMDLDIKSFESFIKSSCNTERVILSYCRLSLDESYDFKLSIGAYSTSYLSFYHCGKASKEPWYKNPEKFENIVDAISKCSLKNSLKQINIKDCHLKKRFVMEMFMERGMEIEVIMEDNSPSVI